MNFFKRYFFILFLFAVNLTPRTLLAEAPYHCSGTAIIATKETKERASLNCAGNFAMTVEDRVAAKRKELGYFTGSWSLVFDPKTSHSECQMLALMGSNVLTGVSEYKGKKQAENLTLTFVVPGGKDVFLMKGQIDPFFITGNTTFKNPYLGEFSGQSAELTVTCLKVQDK